MYERNTTVFVILECCGFSNPLFGIFLNPTIILPWKGGHTRSVKVRTMFVSGLNRIKINSFRAINCYNAPGVICFGKHQVLVEDRHAANCSSTIPRIRVFNRFTNLERGFGILNRFRSLTQLIKRETHIAYRCLPRADLRSHAQSSTVAHKTQSPCASRPKWRRRYPSCPARCLPRADLRSHEQSINACS